MNRNLPDTASIGSDGSVQLNAKKADDGLTLAEKTRRAVAEAQRNL